jgi:glycosyltransferase involved in cell wall biosynthesis
LDNAEGDYILFLDSDDWLKNNTLEVLAANLNDEDMLCFSGRRFFEASNTFHPSDQLQERYYPSGMDYYNDNALLRRDFAFVCVVLRSYKRSFLIENGLRFKEGIYHEDNLFTPLACYHAHSVRVINECLYDYRVRESSITTTDNPQRHKDLMETANELAAFFILKSGFDKTVVYRVITHHYQVSFLNPTKELNKICDWRLYHIVSKTKPRHLWNYWKKRISAI